MAVDQSEERKTTSSIITCKAIAVFFVGTHLLRLIFSSVYFQQIGLSSTYTGIVMGASPISSAIGGIIFGYIADRTDMRKVVFLGSYFAYALTPILITIAQPAYQCREPSRINMTNASQSVLNRTSKLEAIHYQYVSVNKNVFLGKPESPNTIKDDYEKNLFVIELVITIFGDFHAGASINLADTLLVGAVDDKKQYGKIRLWGNIGQAVTIPSIAILTYFKTVDICGVPVSDFKYALYSASLISFIGLIFSIFKVHFPSSKGDKDVKNEKGEGSLTELIASLETRSFLIICFFFGVFNSAITSFLFWTMVGLNHSQANLSIAVANFIRNAVSLVTYLLVPKLLHALGYRRVMSFSCLIYATTFVVIAVMRSSWLGSLVELLAGSAYAITMAACVSYIGEVAHPSLAVTAQGLLHFMFTGIGSAAGPAMAGVIMDHAGQTITFLIFAVMCIVLMIFSIIVQWILKVRQGDYEELGKNQGYDGEQAKDQD